MIIRQRGRAAFAVGLLLALVAACTTGGGSLPDRSTPRSSSSSSPTVTSSHATPPRSATRTAPTVHSTVPPGVRPVTRVQLHPAQGQLTHDGMWWAVDSVAPIGAQSLANVRGWYRGAPKPVAWGRYVSGHYGVTRAELTYARAHGIGVYFIVPDANCSACTGGDACGNDRTSVQARLDARDAVRAAVRLRLPRGVTLYKDIEEVGACHGELTAAYLLTWYRYVTNTTFVPGFYGNTNKQDYDFPRAYCAAVAKDSRFAHDVPLAQDEPEPQLGASRGSVGPVNAPRFRPHHPNCTPLAKVRIWQYGESIDRANSTDIDEIVPGTHGILAPDGHVT